jgi:hypothetical protein
MLKFFVQIGKFFSNLVTLTFDERLPDVGPILQLIRN